MNKTNSVAISKLGLERKGLLPDQVRMNGQTKQHIEYFEIHNIEKYQEFITKLHDYKYSKKDQVKVIEKFIKYMKKTENVEITLMKKREMEKINSDKRNILMNRIAHEYPDKFISFLNEKLGKIFPQKNKIDELIIDFQAMIKELHSVDFTKPEVKIFDESIDIKNYVNLLNQPEENDSLEFVDEVLEEDEFIDFTYLYNGMTFMG